MTMQQPKPYWEMTTAELREATKEFDREMVPGRPLTPEMKAKLRRARSKPGRPKIGKGAARVLITVERGLLGRADSFAKRHNLSRSQLIARGLEVVLNGGR
jgi:hypothetical protein